MASNMQLAERRWTSTRKSGMTVLGKVPKPINLPSQKSENNGLDSNVEIVPKGTLTWGTRPLLAASSAWGSSNLSSPRADGNVASPIYANDHPSSGGSCTRPSTGSSERSSEPIATSSWGASSRPSSASGILPSSHMSVPTNRPRSADTRPSSSHLSRFAESSADSIAWGAAGASEKVAAEASKKSDFILSSGDFPILGSEKSDEPKSQEGQNPKIPAPLAPGISSSLNETSESLLTSGNGNSDLAMHGNFNSWMADTCAHAGEGSSIRTDNWHRDTLNAQLLLDANIPARQYGPWHGPPHHPNVVWYGGGEIGGLYRPSFGPLSSYQVDPYYPYVPAGALPNTQVFPRAEAITGGVHFNKKGEACRPMLPESYIGHTQSSIHVRPGVSGPVLSEGCYGPSVTSFANSSDQDDSSLGIPGHCVHNQHLSENLRHQPWMAQPDGSAPVMTKRQMICGQSNETQGQYKVLLRQHGREEEKFSNEHTVTVGPAPQRGKQPSFSMTEPGLIENSYKQEQLTDEQHGEVSHSRHPNDLVDHNNKHFSGTSKPAGQNVKKKIDTTAAHSSEQQYAIVKKNASLMEKVEGLNSKTRVVDVHFEGGNFPTKGLKSNKNSSSDEGHFVEVGKTNSNFANNTSISGTTNVGASKLNTSTKVIHESVLELKPTHPMHELVIAPCKPNYSEDCGQSEHHYQKKVRNMKGRVDHQGKLKFGSYGTDEINNTRESDSFQKGCVTTGRSEFLLSSPGSHAAQVVPEELGSHLNFNSVSDPSSLKSVDHDVQHAKLKELARQRAIELQKEEEERTAEQKAKALVKLAELNKRASGSSKQNSKNSQPLYNDNPIKPDTTSGEDENASTVSETLHGGLCDFLVKKHPNDGNINKLREPVDLSFTQPSGTSDSVVQVCVSAAEESRKLSHENIQEIVTRSALDLQDIIISRRKQAGGYRRKRNITDERNQFEKLTNSESSGNTRGASMVAEGASVGLGILNSDPPIQASKIKRGPKYKNKFSYTQLNSTHRVGDFEKFEVDSDESKPLAKLSEHLSVRENNSNEILNGQDSIDLIVEPNQAGSEPTNLASERANNNWKPQAHRKSARNLQYDKANAKYQSSETVVWAPVKVVSNDGPTEVHKCSASELTNLPDGKNVQDMHNYAKARRAEIERYVPKPIAKELSLQGDSHQSSPLAASASSSDKAGKRELASASVVTGRDVSSTITKLASNSVYTEDIKQSRHGKTHPSWRQRNSGVFASHEQSALEVGLSSGPSKSVEKKSEHHHSRPSNDLHVEGDNNLHDMPMATLGIVEDHRVTRKGRQQFKVVSVDGSNCAPSHSKVLQGEVPYRKEMHYPGLADSGEKNPSRNENHNVCTNHMKSHWQPKSQVHYQHYLHGFKSSGAQRTAEKFLPSQTTEKNLEGNGCVGERNMIEVDDMKFQKGHRERKAMTYDMKILEGTRERMVMKQPSKDKESIDCDLTAPTEASSADADDYPEYNHMPRWGRTRGHFSIGGDAIYGESKKSHSMRNVEQHFECRTGYNKDDMHEKSSSASEEASEAHRNSNGLRYGIQGRNNYRRGGHFYGTRRGASVRVNGSYDIGG